MRLVLDDLDHDRQVRGQLDQTGRVDDAVGAKAGDAVDDGGACEAFGSESLQERARQRRVPHRSDSPRKIRTRN